MKNFISIVALLVFVQTLIAEDIYQLVRVYYSLPQQLNTIAETVFPWITFDTSVVYT